MARPISSRLNSVRKRRKDGTELVYYYERGTNLFLGHDKDAAMARVLAKAPDHAPSMVAPGSIDALVIEYLKHPKFTGLSPRTRKLYRGYLDLIRREWGDLPVRGLKPGHIERIKLQFASQPRKSNQTIGLLHILLKLAVKLGWVENNAADNPGKLPTPARTQIWTDADEDAFLAVASPRLRLALLLLLYTAQRPGDVLAMATGNVRERDGRLWIELRQQKTAELISLPVHERLAPELAKRLAQPIESLLLVPSPRGRRWAYRNFCRAWDATMRKAGLASLRRQDLRRTAIVRLAEAGATVPQISAVSGHTIDRTAKIIETYLPRRSEVAAAAITAWETNREAKLIRLPTATARN